MGVNSVDLRNFTIAGHNGTGKTAFLEQLLYYTGAISKPEMAESGKTVSDYTEEEIARKISIHCAFATMDWKGKTLNALDTPGTADFIGEVICGLRSCETAVMMVDAREGAQIETIKLWRRLNNRNMPRVLFLNKMDKERVDYDKTMEHLRGELKMTLVPITIPMGQAASFTGIINLISNKAYLIQDGAQEKEIEIPAEYADKVEEARSVLIEAAAEGADELMEKFFEEGTLDASEIAKGLKEGLDKNLLVPVFCGNTLKGSGITSFLNFVAETFPNPLGKNDFIYNAKDETKKIMPKAIEESSEISAYVFKTTIDQFSGKLSFIKVITGTLLPDTDLINPEIGKKERPGKLYKAVGKKIIEVPSLCAGEIGILTKSNSANTNSTLMGGSDFGFRFQPLQFPAPIYALAISAPDKNSEVKMNDFIHRVTEEDLTFQSNFNEETKESVISGMGELHLNMILDKVKDKQKIQINTKIPKIAYRETITKKSGIAEYAHKKQSGGHGQYGKVLLEIEPSERGAYYTFTNAIKGGSISKGYIPGIEKGLHEAMVEGFLAGYPLVDIAVTLIDGKEHPVDSSEMAFKLAAKGAIRAALEKAGAVLLEPYMKLTVYIDNQYLGDVLSDLSSKRGRVLGQEDLGGNMIAVNAEVPDAEMLTYAIDLKAMTSGTGSFELEFDHYETLQGKLAEDVIKTAKAEAEEASK
ncbi:MAG: elongation factor G [Sphaerochaetaceae bacterium]|jgi:elongation factor G|nr:elongation factor G [Sphaerochaetaceae bacterium]